MHCWYPFGVTWIHPDTRMASLTRMWLSDLKPFYLYPVRLQTTWGVNMDKYTDSLTNSAIKIQNLHYRYTRTVCLMSLGHFHATSLSPSTCMLFIAHFICFGYFLPNKQYKLYF